MAQWSALSWADRQQKRGGGFEKVGMREGFEVREGGGGWKGSATFKWEQGEEEGLCEGKSEAVTSMWKLVVVGGVGGEKATVGY